MLPDMPHRKPVFHLFGYALRFGTHGCVCGALLVSTLTGGCGETRDDGGLEKYADQSAAVLTPETSPGAPEPGAARGWSVLVAMVPSGRSDDAERMLRTVQTAGLDRAFIGSRSGRPVIAFGSYDDPGSEEAQAGLARVRAVQVSEMRPFATAVLMPPPAVRSAGGADSLDLRGVKARLGDVAVYTLQIGVYGRADYQHPTQEELALFREQAELAVQKLRGDGEKAFFYHGPNSSSVTIGVFSEDDHDGNTMPAVESPGLRALRQRFPNNLLNSEGLMETVKTDRGPVKRLQASRLVAIPKK